MLGAGRALPHKGLSALQAWKKSKASRSTLSGRKKALILFIWDRTIGWDRYGCRPSRTLSKRVVTLPVGTELELLLITVGTTITGCPPYRPGRALLSASGSYRR